jgi:hypothetical protein
MRFVTLREGFVTERSADPGPGAVAAGPRTVVLPNGEVLCSCMLTSKLTTNDFVTMLYRSADGGVTWAEQGPLWPDWKDRWSSFVSVSRDAAGSVYAFGSRCPIDTPGETFWSDATQGIKPNELIWTRSTDGGRTWTERAVVPMPIPGAAEAPGPLCVTRGGRWLGPYSPYNTFDPNVAVDRNQVVVVASDDRGQTWWHASMLRFDDRASTAAEAWVVELADGRLLGTGWHLNQRDGSDYPNAYALSHDGGSTWTPTRSTGIRGQSTALAALPDGRGLFLYNQRKHGEVGVWLAVVRPSETDFGVEANEIVWRAETPTRRGTSGEHSAWEDFSFGEPSVSVLPNDTLLVTLWCIQPSGRGIRYVHLKPSR